MRRDGVDAACRLRGRWGPAEWGHSGCLTRPPHHLRHARFHTLQPGWLMLPLIRARERRIPDVHCKGSVGEPNGPNWVIRPSDEVIGCS